MAACRRTFFSAIAVLVICSVATSAATIKDVHIPRYVKNDSASIDLLCEFVRGDMDKHLVLKWFHSGDSSPVFQWIPEMDLFEVSGVLTGHVDTANARKMSSTRSEDLTSRFGIRVDRPTTKHEGIYKCYVTSIANTDEREANVVVYVPPRETQLFYNEDRRMMTCRIQRVYPLPMVTLYRSTKKGDLVEETEFVKREDKANEDGTFDIFVRKYMSRAPPERFECWTSLDIDYKVLAKAHYLPTKQSVIESGVSADATGVYRINFTVLLLWFTPAVVAAMTAVL